MFIYHSPRSQETKTIDIKPQACLQARIVDGIRWDKISRVDKTQSALERTARYGKDATMRNMMDVRLTPEWRIEIEKFAADGEHDLDLCLKLAMSSKREMNGSKTTAENDPPRNEENGFTTDIRADNARIRTDNARLREDNACLREDNARLESELVQCQKQRAELYEMVHRIQEETRDVLQANQPAEA